MKVIVILVVIFSGSGQPTVHYEYPMPDFETCFASVEKAQVQFSTGAKSEGGVIVFCATPR